MDGLERIIERYGGWARWERLGSITLRMVHVGGPLPRLKGLGRTFPVPSTVRVLPHQLRTEFLEYPEAGRTSVFERGRVAVPGHPGGPQAVELAEHRSSFAGLRKYRRWSAPDAVYFFGYALTTYLSIPFLLPSLRTELRPWRAGGLRVRAEFPDSLHTHGPHQEFFFDVEGLLRRHDYTAEIVGRWARGSHFSSDYVEVEGLPIARRRQVYARLGGAVTPLPVLSAQLEPLAVD